MVNLITRKVGMAIVWRLYGDSVKSDTFYGDFYGKISLETVQGFHGQNMAIKSNCQTISMLILP